MRCVLDIGVQKTGSKARQIFFAHQLGRIVQTQALYPTTGREGIWHEPLCFALERGDCSILETVVQEAETSHSDLVILSSETLHGLQKEQITWLKQAFDDVTACVFLRRQDQLVNSFHNQLHKAHRISLGVIEEYESDMINYRPDYDYQNILERWAGVLGFEQVVPIVFDKSRSPILDFFGNAGIELDYEGYTESYPNRAINMFGMSVMRWIKRLAHDEQELPNIMTKAHQVLSAHFVEHDFVESRYSISFEMRTKIMEQYLESNEWVRKHFFPSTTELFPALETGTYQEIDFSLGKEVAEQIISDARSVYC